MHVICLIGCVLVSNVFCTSSAPFFFSTYFIFVCCGYSQRIKTMCKSKDRRAMISITFKKWKNSLCVCVFSQRYDWFMIPRWRPSYILKFSSSSPHLLERERERNILFLVWFDNNYTTVLKNNLLFYFII